MNLLMPTRNIVLTDHQAAMVDQLVSSGRYQNASEVLREGLRLVERQDMEEQARLSALRDAVRIGIADLDAGRFHEFDSAADLERHLDALVDSTLGSPTRAIEQ